MDRRQALEPAIRAIPGLVHAWKSEEKDRELWTRAAVDK
jgi:hypothetical protein